MYHVHMLAPIRFFKNFHNTSNYFLFTFQNVNKIYAIKSILNYGIPSFSTLKLQAIELFNMDITKKGQIKIFSPSLFTYVSQ
jgi:hypothetical protein